LLNFNAAVATVFEEPIDHLVSFPSHCVVVNQEKRQKNASTVAGEIGNRELSAGIRSLT
jgi:hypothetical protein